MPQQQVDVPFRHKCKPSCNPSQQQDFNGRLCSDLAIDAICKSITEGKRLQTSSPQTSAPDL
jgi:hypothetical protein